MTTTRMTKAAKAYLLKRHLLRGTLYLVVTALGVIFMLPFVFALSSSLKTHVQIHEFPPRWIPTTIHWDNYAEVFRQVPFGKFIKNSMLVVVLAGSGQIVSAVMVAYGFARFRFPGREVLFMLVLSTMMLPWVVTVIPTFILFKYLGWLNSLKPLIVPAYFGGGAFFIFLLRQFFMTIPLDLDEAAIIDGANRATILLKVILPLSKPAIATVAIFSLLGSWNDFFGPLIFLDSQEKFTVALGLRLLQQTAHLGGRPVDQLLMAASMMTTLPVVLLFFVMQKYFIQGIVMTGLKG